MADKKATSRTQPGKKALLRSRQRQTEKAIGVRLKKGEKIATIADGVFKSKRQVQRIRKRVFKGVPLKLGRPRSGISADEIGDMLPIYDEIDGTEYLLRVLADQEDKVAGLARKHKISQKTVMRRAAENTFSPDEITGAVIVYSSRWGYIWTRLLKVKK